MSFLTTTKINGLKNAKMLQFVIPNHCTENIRLSKVVPKVTALLLKGCQGISEVVKRLSY